MDEMNATVAEQTVEQPTETKQPEPAEKPETAEIAKLKAALTKASSDAAEWKRQLREKQTESERAEAERAEQDKAMREELATLRRDKSISEYTAKCVTLNMDAELAAKTANAMADGDMNAVFDCLTAFVEATKTRINNELLNRQPTLSAGTPPTKGDTEDDITAKLRRYAGLPVHR